MAFYTADYTSLGVKPLPFNIVGTDPAKGAATTTIPTVIVPIKIVYQTVGGVSLDGTNVVPAAKTRQHFLTADYSAGTTDLGVTQYGDAIERAQFWGLPTFLPNYHVPLGTPAIAPTVTLTVTSPSQGNLYLLRSGALLGVIAQSFLDPAIDALTASYPANTLPIFLLDNVYESFSRAITPVLHSWLHAAQAGPAVTAKTWIYAAYTEPGTFVNNVMVDVLALRHEVAE